MKRILLFFLAISVLGCSKSDSPDGGGTSAPKISLNKQTLILEKGTSERLIAAFSPADTPNKGHVWSSDAPSIVAVDETGQVTAVAPGEAAVTVTALDGNSTATCRVTVVNKIIPVTEVSLDLTETTLAEGKSIKLTAVIKPDDATDKKVIWSSDANEIATVDGQGNVVAVAAGKAVITAASGSGDKSASCQVTVIKSGVWISAPKVSNITSSTALVEGTFQAFDVTIEEEGLCFSTSSSPVVGDNDVVLSGDRVAYTLTKLAPATTYYVRLYAKVNGEIKYGEITTLTTLAVIKTNFKPTEFSSMTTSSIKFVSPAPAGIGSVNVCYGRSPNPKVTDNVTTATKGSDGKLYLTLDNLISGTTYYLRAYQQVGGKIEYFDDEVSAQTMGGDEFSITHSFIDYDFDAEHRLFGFYRMNYKIKSPGLYSATGFVAGRTTKFQASSVGGEYAPSCYVESGEGTFYEATWGFRITSSAESADYVINVKLTNLETGVIYYYSRGDSRPIYWDR